MVQVATVEKRSPRLLGIERFGERSDLQRPYTRQALSATEDENILDAKLLWPLEVLAFWAHCCATGVLA